MTDVQIYKMSGAGNDFVVLDGRGADMDGFRRPERIAELYWDVFSGCFAHMDFNPVSFRFHDAGWDSIAQMNLICRLEETFHISFKGRETMKITSYRAGLELVRKKIRDRAEEK